jgi:aldose 1-epimerase
MGFHPYFKRRLTALDQDVVVVVPAEKVYPALHSIPTAPAQPVKDKTDLRRFALLGHPNLDECYTAFTEQQVRIVYPETKVEVRLKLEPVFKHVVVYAPNDSYGRAKDFVAVEPATNANDGFNLFDRGWLGTGVKVLKPGEQWGGSFSLEVLDL